MVHVVPKRRAGRPSSLTERQIEQIRKALAAGLNITQIHKALDIPYSTARDYVNRLENESPVALASDPGLVVNHEGGHVQSDSTPSAKPGATAEGEES